ncbi:WD40 repeat domain-containing protein [Spirillospora sp. CA-142024]|uniref:WD40 repeat domain-containing protein n=1 Tax=Spirillospora sp. CA-142024 TaxID=3240036 RepID=UPI003D8FBB92
MAKIIDYGRFAERLAEDRPVLELLGEVQREWGYEDPGGEPLVTREGEAPGYEPDESDPVPAALIEWWDSPVNSFAFRPRLYWTHSVWPPSGPDSVDDPPGDEIRMFMAEYEYVNQWGYLASEARLPDPKVLVNSSEGWVVQSRSISEFFLQLAMERLPGTFGWSFRVSREDVEADPAIVERLQETYRDVGLLPWQEAGTDALTFGGPDVLIRHGRGPGAGYAVVVHGRTREALVQALDTLGITWTDKEISAPSEVPLPTEDLEPASFTDGDADDRLRWTVASAAAASGVPAVPDVPALRGLADRTAAAADREATTVVAGDSAGHVHVWAADGEELAVQKPHRAPVTAVACYRGSDGTRVVVSGDEAGVVRRWAAQGDLPRVPLDRRRSPVSALAAARLETGPALAAAWADGLVRVWDLVSGEIADLRIGTGIEALALRKEGSLHVSTAQGSAELRLDLERLWPARPLRLRLREIDWGSLWAARGPAHEVPGLIAKVASDDEDTAQAAVKRLYELLAYRGDASPSAAVQAVPFLVERMLIPTNRARNTLLLLIADIADGPGDAHDAVKEALPSLLHLQDDENSSIRWAAAELVRNCGAAAGTS